jgi:hypothetical protein
MCPRLACPKIYSPSRKILCGVAERAGSRFVFPDQSRHCEARDSAMKQSTTGITLPRWIASLRSQ